MDRSIVLVDAGYLLGAAHTTVSSRGLMGSASIKYPELLAGLVAQAEERTGVPTLRVYWYSPWPETHSGADLRTLQQLPNVKVRLGAAQGEINDQAGVSTPLQRDLITLARNHAVSDAILLTADENLTGAIEEAQTFGIRVHLWGVQAASGSHGQSHTMIASADCRIVISAAWVGQHVDVLPSSTAIESDQTGLRELLDDTSTPITGASESADQMFSTDRTPLWNSEPLEIPLPEPFAPDRTWTGITSDPPDSRRSIRALESTEGTSSFADSDPMIPTQTRRSAARLGQRSDAQNLDSPHWPENNLGQSRPLADSSLGAEDGSPSVLDAPLIYGQIEDYLSDWSSSSGSTTASDGLSSYTALDAPAVASLDRPESYDVHSATSPIRSDSIMRLAEITTEAQASVDYHQDSAAYGLSVDEIGYRFGLRWASRTSADQLDALVGRYAPPNLPRKIATELDEYAAQMGVDGPESELIHHALALAFWAALVPAASERF